MDRDFIESLKDLTESEIEEKLKEEGWNRASVPFMMASQEVSRIVLPMGGEKHKEVLILDYNVLRPEQYSSHKAYAIFTKS